LDVLAKLIVVAQSEDTVAAPGNMQPNYIVVSVTDADEKPVTGLTLANFKVQPIIVGPGGVLVHISSVSASTLPGFYIVNIIPVNNQTWKAGVYIFAVAISRGNDNGQTLASVSMD
jgi:hypothetical protein